MASKRKSKAKPIKFTKKVSLNNYLVIAFVAILTLSILVGGYINSRKLDVREGDAYQGEPCTTTGVTRCEAISGTLTGKIETCAGGIWNVTSCPSGQTCSATTGNCAVPPPTCSSGQTRCYSSTQVQVCSSSGVWQNPSNCSTGICSGTVASGACSTPTPVPSCSAGMTRCSGTQVQVCTNGVWQTPSNCPTGRACVGTSTSGACATPTPPPPTPIGGCFLAGTKVATATGNKNIEEVLIGDKVLSFNSNTVNNSDVTNLYKVTRDHYYKITAGESTVSVTAEHPFYVGNDNYVEAKDLKTGGLVYLLNSNSLTPDTVRSVEKVKENVEAYNLTVDSDHTFFANGFAVHNKTTNPYVNGMEEVIALCKAKISSKYGSSYTGAYAISQNSKGGIGDCKENTNNIKMGTVVSSSYPNGSGGYYNTTAMCCMNLASYNSIVNTNAPSGTVYAYFQGLAAPESVTVKYTCQLRSTEKINCVRNANWTYRIDELKNKVATADLFDPNGVKHPFLYSVTPQEDAKVCTNLYKNYWGNVKTSYGFYCP